MDVLLLDPGVSRRHASLRPGEDGGWSIEDLHSTRGTWVNGRRLAPGEITAIVEGDLVEINPWSLLVLGREATAGIVLDDGDVGGSIAEAVSDPQLRDRFDGLVSAVRRASTRTRGPPRGSGQCWRGCSRRSDADRSSTGHKTTKEDPQNPADFYERNRRILLIPPSGR